MKSSNYFIAIIAFAVLGMLNYTYSENILVKAQAQNTSSSSSSSNNSSSSSNENSAPSTTDCCHKWKIWQSCNQRLAKSENVHVDCRTLYITYYGYAGESEVETVFQGKVIVPISASLKAHHKRTSMVSSGYDFYADVITCPTDGHCDDCKEYRPSCSNS